MKLHDSESLFVRELADLYDANEAREIHSLVIEEELAISKSRFRLERNYIISSEEKHRIVHHLTGLKNGIPVQYQLGRAWFMRMKLYVSPAVLIPRPETEELVDRICREQRNMAEGVRIIDMGTGSGCIALGLKQCLPSAEIHAMDICGEALEMARKNANEQSLEIQFLQGDMLEWDAFFHPSQQYDVVVSNPPYITRDEQIDMHLNVLQYEPHIALFVENETPLLYYSHIASFAHYHLNPGGYVYVEINANMANETRSLFIKKGFESVVIYQDMQGKERFVQAKKPL